MTEYCRIALLKTNYELSLAAKLLTVGGREENYARINEIYTTYCRYKKFTSVMPLFYEEFLNVKSDVIGYYHANELVAWSLLTSYDNENVEGIQFAWDYKTPSLHLGTVSLQHECAYYKKLGYSYLYLGEAATYKSLIQGYEILGEI